MLKWSFVLLLGLAFCTGTTLRAEEWGVRHPEARARLLKIFEHHAGFREAFVEYTNDHHATFKEMVEFVAKKDEHTVAEFVRLRAKEDKETPALARIHDKYKEAFVEFRDFVHEHKEAALALTEHEREIEKLDRIAEKRSEK